MVDIEKVDYRDPTPFNQNSLQDIQTIKDAILHKQNGESVRAPIAQIPDALIKLFQEDGIDQNTEVKEARGKFETLGIHETAQDSQIDANYDLAMKADERSTDAKDAAQASTSNSPKETFANKAALEKAYPNGAQGLYVTQDNGHWWYFSGVWKDGGVWQAQGIADKSVTSSKLASEVRVNGLNTGGGDMSLSWKQGYVSNKAKQDDDGTPEGTIITGNSFFNMSQPIIVHKGDLVSVRAQMGTLGSMISMWNPNNEYRANLFDGLGKDTWAIIQVPMNGYIIISNNTDNYSNDNVIVRRYPSFAFQSLPKELIGSVEWGRMPLVWTSRAYIGSASNSGHPNELVQNSGLDDENRVSELFYVTKGMTVTTNAAHVTSGYTLAEFKEDGTTFVRGLMTGDGKTGTHSIYLDHNAYLRAATRRGIQDSVTVSTSKTNKIGVSELDGKIIDVLGDSYVDNMNDPIEESWHYKIAQKHNMKYNNYGLHGNGLVSPNGNGTPVVDRFDEIDSKADYVIIMSGQNDYRKQLPLEDFRKGIDKIIKGVAGNCTGAKMAFFTMWSRGDTENQSIPQADYAQVMLDECKLFGVPCFNSFANSDNRVWDADFRKKYMQGSTDISHMNAAGHERFMPKAEAFLNSL